MTGYQVVAIQPDIVDEVRTTRKSPGYGHLVVSEIAMGTGPCRSCLAQFEVGKERRLRFTYQPPSGSGALGAPGPVFVHEEPCTRVEAPGFPAGLSAPPLVLEGRTKDGRTLDSRSVPEGAAEPAIAELFESPDVDFLFLRHGEAGCHIAQVQRASNTI